MYKRQLCHMVSTVFAVDVINDFLSAFVAEIHIEVRHADTLRVQKAFKDQIIADGVDIRDAHTVSRNAACAGAAARAHRDALTLGVVDVVPHDEVVAAKVYMIYGYLYPNSRLYRKKVQVHQMSIVRLAEIPRIIDVYKRQVQYIQNGMGKSTQKEKRGNQNEGHTVLSAHQWYSFLFHNMIIPDNRCKAIDNCGCKDNKTPGLYPTFSYSLLYGATFSLTLLPSYNVKP